MAGKWGAADHQPAGRSGEPASSGGRWETDRGSLALHAPLGRTALSHRTYPAVRASLLLLLLLAAH